MLYIGTAEELPTSSSPDLRIETVSAARQDVKRWFSQPAVSFVGAHTGCSCGFPSIMAESPLDYYDGMPLQSDDRAADLRSVRALELYPVPDGDELKEPKGVIEWEMNALDTERFFFNERFLHVVHR